MCASYSDEQIQDKLSRLSPEMQAAFLNATKELFHWESDLFLHVIAESRNDITDHGVDPDFDEEMLSLRSRSSRMEAEKSRLERVRSRAMAGTAAITYESEQDRAAVDNYLKAVGREKTDISYGRPVSASSESWASARAGTSYKMRIQDKGFEEDEEEERPITVMQHKDEVTMLKEKDLLLERLKSQGDIALSERQRQMNLIQKKKDERKEKKKGAQDKVSAMMNETSDMDIIQQKNQQRQQDLVQERLEKKRRQREKTMENLRMQSISQDEIDSAMARRRSIRLESLTAADVEEGSALKKALSSLQLNQSLNEGDEEGATSPRPSREHKSKDKRKSSRSKSQPRNGDMEEGRATGGESERIDRITKMFEIDETTGTPVSPRPGNEDKKKKKKKKKREPESADSEV